VLLGLGLAFLCFLKYHQFVRIGVSFHVFSVFIETTPFLRYLKIQSELNHFRFDRIVNLYVRIILGVVSIRLISRK